MKKFNIGDTVIVSNTYHVGVITDKMYSEARNMFLYTIKPDNGGKQISRTEDDIEPFADDATYEIRTEIADNVVIVVLYETICGASREVCRGHGHIIRDGAEGIAQAMSYAAKRAFFAIDSGVYFKQNGEDYGK